jgi:putative SOS response-associated peptidase YedK
MQSFPPTVYRSPCRACGNAGAIVVPVLTVQTFTIITTVPNELCGAIHDRMPVILPREKWPTWLGECEADPDELRWMVLRSYPTGLMRAYPVDVRVGNVRNNDARLLDEISLAA